jgi:hypothetical protein
MLIEFTWRRKKMKSTLNLVGDNFLDQLAAPDQWHPGFLLHSQVGIVTVLVLQSVGMSYQLLKDTVLHEPVNGLVSYAAHGYWHMHNWLLIISSVYSGTFMHGFQPFSQSQMVEPKSIIAFTSLHFLQALQNNVRNVDKRS